MCFDPMFAFGGILTPLQHGMCLFSAELHIVNICVHKSALLCASIPLFTFLCIFSNWVSAVFVCLFKCSNIQFQFLFVTNLASILKSLTQLHAVIVFLPKPSKLPFPANKWLFWQSVSKKYGTIIHFMTDTLKNMVQLYILRLTLPPVQKLI